MAKAEFFSKEKAYFFIEVKCQTSEIVGSRKVSYIPEERNKEFPHTFMIAEALLC